MKKTIILCLASAIVGAMAGWFTNQKVNNCDPYTGMSYEDIARDRLHMIAAQDSLLHEVYSYNSDYWDDVLMETDQYYTLDSIRGGNWEDFYRY